MYMPAEPPHLTAFNLINAVDVEETDRKILAYQRENAEQIDMQSSFEDKHAELIRAQDEEERRRKQEQAAEFAQRDAAERAEREKEEQELLQLLEASGEGEDASKVIRKHRAVALKRSSARMASDTTQSSHTGAGSGKPSLLSRYAGFNRNSFAAEQNKKDPFAPEDPMADYDTAFYDYRDLFTLRSVEQPYVDKGTHEVLRDGKKQGGGFDVRKSVWERAIRSAVMGLWTPLVGVSDAGVKTDRDGDAVMS
jgi:CDK-activating kinase assembly factor MAT1